jgi:hypothetical protein
MKPIVIILAAQAQQQARVPIPLMPKELGASIVGKDAVEFFAKAIVADCMAEVRKLVSADTASAVEQQINEHFGF